MIFENLNASYASVIKFALVSSLAKAAAAASEESKSDTTGAYYVVYLS